MRNTIAPEERLAARSDSEDLLRRFLSIGSVVSMSSSSAERQQSAAYAVSKFRHIGAGQCGTIFEVPGATCVYKVAKRLDDHLWNDYCMHALIFEACKTAPHQLGFRVPTPHFFISDRDEDWWTENLHRFPEEYRRRDARILCTERVLPLVQPIRDALIDLYCPKEIRLQAKTKPGEQDCLIRVYLGKKREDFPRVKKPTWSLRNYKLHLDQMFKLGLEVQHFAESMADALAIMHWSAGVDAGDVEFIPGSLPGNMIVDNVIFRALSAAEIDALPPNTSTRVRQGRNFKSRYTQLWLIDFNRCKSITRDMDGIAQAVAAFYINDPYYPRPCGATKAEQLLWDCFRTRYLTTSASYVDDEAKDLPTKFVDALVEAQMIRNEKNRLAGERVRAMEEEEDLIEASRKELKSSVIG
jgi:hypothetical protein